MAAGDRSDWAGVGHLPDGLIYPDLVHGGLVETLVQNTEAFNVASRNTIRLVNNRKLGDYAQESFWGLVDNLITRRDTDSTADATVLPVPKDELISIKINRKIGPVDQTFDSFRKIQKLGTAGLQTLSFLLGTQIGKAMQVDQLESALRSVVAGLSGTPALYNDRIQGASPIGSETITTTGLVDTLSNFGDAAGRVSMWVMHSKTYYDLVKEQITANIDGLSNFNVASATPVTLNRPVLVTDSEALKVYDSASPRSLLGYQVLGLVQDAVVVEDSEEEMLHNEVVSGKENIIARLQGEYAYNVGLKGFKWDVTNGGINPLDAALATTTNWDQVMTSVKDLGGVIGAFA